MTEASWLKKVRAEEKKVPAWLVQIFDHPMFVNLQRQEDGTWWIFTAEEMQFDAPTLDDICRQFAEHYRI